MKAGICFELKWWAKLNTLNVTDARTQAYGCHRPSFLFPMTETFQTIEGEIEGALVTVLVPPLWNRLLLLYAHGHRPPGTRKAAEFDSNDDYHMKLVQQGR